MGESSGLQSLTVLGAVVFLQAVFSEAVREVLARATTATMKEVIVYSTESCPYCRQAERFLKDKGVPFQTIDVTDDDEMRAKLVEMSEGRRTVPQIFIGGRPIGGYSDLIALNHKGALLSLLKSQ